MPSVSAATSLIGRSVAAFAISMSDSTVVDPSLDDSPAEVSTKWSPGDPNV